jgi:signal transduction histidine kinase
VQISLLQASLKVRLALLLGTLLVAFLGCLQILRTVERHQAEALQRESLASSEQLLRKWIELTNQPLRRFVQDFSQWPPLASFAARPDKAWADVNLRPNLGSYEAHALWIVDAAGQLVYSAQINPGPALALPPLGPAGGSFFAEGRDGLLEIWQAPIAPPGTAAAGTLVVARLWGNRHLATLGRLHDAELLLLPPDAVVGTAPAAEVRLALADAGGRPLRHLVARPSPVIAGDAAGRDAPTAYLFLAFATLVVLALWLAVRFWVLGPLDRIGESLRREDPAPIQPLLRERTELGQVARLVESAFSQKAALGREIEQHRRTEAALRESEARLRNVLELRARLARDLHDGVIQSIYAAGLGLEGAMTQLDKDPEGARVRLQLCRQSLNEVIREVRGFINGIEPEALHHQGFEQELGSLVRTMQALWPVLIHVQADPAVVARLTANQELHALQICREGISNAVRHGGAREIEVHLAAENGAAFLRVRDKGRGFDPDVARGRGQGLANLTARARELGGTLDLTARPGAGATIVVRFPLSPQPA